MKKLIESAKMGGWARELIDPQHAGWGLNQNALTKGVIVEMSVWARLTGIWLPGRHTVAGCKEMNEDS